MVTNSFIEGGRRGGKRGERGEGKRGGRGGKRERGSEGGGGGGQPQGVRKNREMRGEEGKRSMTDIRAYIRGLFGLLEKISSGLWSALFCPPSQLTRDRVRSSAAKIHNTPRVDSKCPPPCSVHLTPATPTD